MPTKTTDAPPPEVKPEQAQAQVSTKTGLVLPTERTAPSMDPLRRKFVLYGRAKTGKSTLTSKLAPERTLFIACEPGLDHLNVFRMPPKPAVLSSWADFLQIGELLRQDMRSGEPHFDLIAIDTVDELQRLCRGHVLDDMAKTAGMKGFVHPSDFGYGKGYNAVEEEWRLRIAKLCSLGYGVVFISHAKESEIETRLGEKKKAISPDIGDRGPKEWLLGYVDYVFACDVIDTAEGPRHVLYTQPSETILAGGRVGEDVEPLPPVLPMDGKNLRAALERVSQA